MSSEAEIRARRQAVLAGGAPKYHLQDAQRGKLFARRRLELLLDGGSFVEDGIFANDLAGDLPADGVVTGLGRIGGRSVAVMANDATVKAGSWGSRTVEKILRIQEQAAGLEIPLFYLVDSAGARITEQVAMFPGRRGAGRIFYNQVQLSGRVPQICILFGPSAAGGAYIPAFTDVTAMVEGNASMYLGSPRMAEMVIGERVGLEEMGGARMHATVSGLGDALLPSEPEAIAWARRYFDFMPQNFRSGPPPVPSLPPPELDLAELVPADPGRPFDMHRLIAGILDAGSFLEIKELYAQELIVGLGRLGGAAVGIVANQPLCRGGVLFVDSSDKAARFISLCDAFRIPLVFLSDVPGFMIGTKVERQGIIRHGAKMITAVAEATVPKYCVVVRKAYGAGLYAMAGPAFAPEATIALPTAQIAVMGPEAAVNAVHFNHIQELPPAERPAFVAAERRRYQEDIDIRRLAAELVIDQIVPPGELRAELVRRLGMAGGPTRTQPPKRHGVAPV